jgi:ABC-type sugar transport system, periplasmic component
LLLSLQNTVEKLGLNSDYFSVVPRTLSSGNQFYAIPLMIDNLALFYNKELLAATGETPPRTWWGMQDLAKNIKVTDEKGNLKIASVPLGTTNNIDHWSDIVGLMMVQNGVNLEQPTADPELIQDVLEFYSLFYVRDKVWDATFPNSTLAFATNKTIFYFGPSWRIFNIIDINPNLDFAVTSVPKLPKDLKRNDPEVVEKGEGELSERNWAS